LIFAKAIYKNHIILPKGMVITFDGTEIST